MAADTRQVDVDWPLVFVGRVRPHGRRGQRCKRIARHANGVTLVKFSDGRTHFVLDRMLVRHDEY